MWALLPLLGCHAEGPVGGGAVAGYGRYTRLVAHPTGFSPTSEAVVVTVEGTFPHMAQEGVGASGEVQHASGHDIIFTDQDLNQVPHDLVSYTAATGAYKANVRLPGPGGVPLVFYQFHGKAGLSAATENTAAVYVFPYEAVETDLQFLLQRSASHAVGLAIGLDAPHILQTIVAGSAVLFDVLAGQPDGTIIVSAGSPSSGAVSVEGDAIRYAAPNVQGRYTWSYVLSYQGRLDGGYLRAEVTPGQAPAGAAWDLIPAPYSDRWALLRDNTGASFAQLAGGVRAQGGGQPSTNGDNGAAIVSKAATPAGVILELDTRKLENNLPTSAQTDTFLIIELNATGEGSTSYPADISAWSPSTHMHSHTLRDHTRGCRVTLYYQAQGDTSETRVVTVAPFKANATAGNITPSPSASMPMLQGVTYKWKFHLSGNVLIITQTDPGGTVRTATYTSTDFGAYAAAGRVVILTTARRTVEITNLKVTPEAAGAGGPVSAQIAEDWEDLTAGSTNYTQGAAIGDWTVSQAAGSSAVQIQDVGAPEGKVARLTSQAGDASNTYITQINSIQTIAAPYDLTLRFRTVSQLRSGGAFSFDMAWFGWCASPPPGNPGGADNYYYFGVRPTGWWLGKFAWNGTGYVDQNPPLAQGSAPTFAHGPWRTAKVEARLITGGLNMKVYIDGALIADANDTSAPFLSGAVTFYCFNAQVELSTVTAAPPPTGGNDPTLPPTTGSDAAAYDTFSARSRTVNVSGESQLRQYLAGTYSGGPQSRDEVLLATGNYGGGEWSLTGPNVVYRSASGRGAKFTTKVKLAAADVVLYKAKLDPCTAELMKSAPRSGIVRCEWIMRADAADQPQVILRGADQFIVLNDVTTTGKCLAIQLACTSIDGHRGPNIIDSTDCIRPVIVRNHFHDFTTGSSAPNGYELIKCGGSQNTAYVGLYHDIFENSFKTCRAEEEVISGKAARGKIRSNYFDDCWSAKCRNSAEYQFLGNHIVNPYKPDNCLTAFGQDHEFNGNRVDGGRISLQLGSIDPGDETVPQQRTQPRPWRTVLIGNQAPMMIGGEMGETPKLIPRATVIEGHVSGAISYGSGRLNKGDTSNVSAQTQTTVRATASKAIYPLTTIRPADCGPDAVLTGGGSGSSPTWTSIFTDDGLSSAGTRYVKWGTNGKHTLANQAAGLRMAGGGTDADDNRLVAWINADLTTPDFKLDFTAVRNHPDTAKGHAFMVLLSCKGDGSPVATDPKDTSVAVPSLAYVEANLTGLRATLIALNQNEALEAQMRLRDEPGGEEIGVGSPNTFPSTRNVAHTWSIVKVANQLTISCTPAGGSTKSYSWSSPLVGAKNGVGVGFYCQPLIDMTLSNLTLYKRA